MLSSHSLSLRFEALGIAFVSLKDNLDLTTPSGRFMFQIIAAFGELERVIIAERVRAGLQNAKRRGERLGRPQVAADAAQIVSLRPSGASWRQISAQLGISVRTILRAALGCGRILLATGEATPSSVFLLTCRGIDMYLFLIVTGTRGSETAG
jgi:DNA invertase Pin-like site-specific DNA recombinase